MDYGLQHCGGTHHSHGPTNNGVRLGVKREVVVDVQLGQASQERLDTSGMNTANIVNNNRQDRKDSGP